MSRFWSNIVSALTPYVPGEQPKLPDLVKLNTNENPYGPSPQVLAALREAANDSLRLYPDPSASKLKPLTFLPEPSEILKVLVSVLSSVATMVICIHSIRTCSCNRTPLEMLVTLSRF